MEVLLMPNGGVPLHMVLEPVDSPAWVLYSRGAELRLISREEWEQNGANATSDVSVRPAEALVLARFLRYWLNDEENGPIYDAGGVNATFDF